MTDLDFVIYLPKPVPSGGTRYAEIRVLLTDSWPESINIDSIYIRKSKRTTGVWITDVSSIEKIKKQYSPQELKDLALPYLKLLQKSILSQPNTITFKTSIYCSFLTDSPGRRSTLTIEATQGSADNINICIKELNDVAITTEQASICYELLPIGRLLILARVHFKRLQKKDAPK